MRTMAKTITTARAMSHFFIDFFNLFSSSYIQFRWLRNSSVHLLTEYMGNFKTGLRLC
jgi:hypothetical protein